ncbi:hypothetical protein C7974DRAFT_434463 [Boeremia exigua]|uniref:uncharacterized protein n=1 Tax=Boeremia exigua TaxID=749465 RepID=UPI001E8E0962|nr:uncharacterized protein C7974DRAFT_434463 [Boeremia exigua]KAH6625336.1 hypothetical protein C7974DRAFT_434463 [Boeremia exigua]
MAQEPSSEATLPPLNDNASPQCKSCQMILNTAVDRMKTKDKWWTNCSGCRSKRTTKAHSKRETGPHKSPRPQKKPRALTARETAENLQPTHDSVSSRRKGNPPKSSNELKGWRDIVSLTTSTPAKATDLRPEKPTSTIVPEEIDCSICAEPIMAKDLSALSACTHAPEVCHECFLEWLRQQMEYKSWERLECPVAGCNNTVTHDDVKRLAPDDVFARFDELSIRNILSNDPDFRYCQAEGCSSGQVHDTGTEGYIFRCAECNHRMCTICEVPFHTDETCTQYKERLETEVAEREEELRVKREHEAASSAEVNKISKECPGCGANIQKTSGCDHMTCYRSPCRFEFCYICLAPYRGTQGIRTIGNTAHTPACKYHTTRLVG